MKTKAIVFALVLVSIVTSVGWTENFTLDTRIGNRGSIVYRVSRLAYNLTPELSSRLVNVSLGGLGLTGDINNYRVGVNLIYKMKLMDNLSLEPYVGGSYNSSDDVAGSISGDLGLDAKYKLYDWVSPVIGADLQIYSDSYMLDYYGGLSFPIINAVSIDLLYSALLTNDRHKTGMGGRINIYF